MGTKIRYNCVQMKRQEADRESSSENIIHRQGQDAFKVNEDWWNVDFSRFRIVRENGRTVSTTGIGVRLIIMVEVTDRGSWTVERGLWIGTRKERYASVMQLTLPGMTKKSKISTGMWSG